MYFQMFQLPCNAKNVTFDLSASVEGSLAEEAQCLFGVTVPTDWDVIDDARPILQVWLKSWLSAIFSADSFVSLQ